MFFELICLFIIARFIYKFLFTEGWFKLPLFNKRFSMRRIKYKLDTNDIYDLKMIAINSVGCIPNNPVFKLKGLHNKIVIIIYDNNKPVSFNIMFDYYCINNNDNDDNKYITRFDKLINIYKCLHIGLVLVDKEYQGMGLQMYSSINILLYLLENFYRTIYISDLGRSPSGLKKFNKGVINSYPNLIYNTTNNKIYKTIFNYLCNNFKKDLQISYDSIHNDETFIIKNANDINGGANYLIEHNKSTMSKDSRYNDFIYSNLDTKDELLSIGSVSIFSVIKQKIQTFFNIK